MPQPERAPISQSEGDGALPPTTVEEFFAVDVRVGRVVRAEPLPTARKPAYRLWIDFGPLGERTSSAQITERYTTTDLVGRLVMAVVNLPARRVAGFPSQVLVLGVPTATGVVLLRPDSDVEPGLRMF